MSRPIDYHSPDEGRPQENTLRIENEALRRGFTLIPNYVLRARGISRDAKLLYGILLSYAWQKGNCWPGYETLMGDLQCGRPQLAKYIKELKDTGLIRVQRRGQGLTSVYTIADVQPGDIQKFQNQTSRSSGAKPQGVSKRNGEEYSVEEDPEEEDEEISNYTTPDPTLHKLRSFEGMSSLKFDNVENSNGGGAAARLPGVAHQSRQRPASRSQPNRAAAGPGSPHEPPTDAPRHASRTRRNTRARAEPPPAYIANVVTDLSAELHDEEHTPANLTRALHLFQASGLSVNAFVQRMYEARAITRQQGNVHKPAATGGGLINHMPYFFRVLEDLLGLKDQPPDAPPGTRPRNASQRP